MKFTVQYMYDNNSIFLRLCGSVRRRSNVFFANVKFGLCMGDGGGVGLT